MTKDNNKPYIEFDDFQREHLADSKNAKTYIETAIEEYHEDGNLEFFLLALKDVADAQGGLSKLAKETNLNRQGLYKALSKDGNPTLTTLDSILNNLGFRLTVEPIPEARV